MGTEVLRTTGAGSVLEAFMAGRKETTRRAYAADLRVFADFMETDERGAIEALLDRGHGMANATALAYRTHLQASGLQPSSINRHLATLRSVVALARVVGAIPWRLDVANLRVESFRDTRGPGTRAFREMLSETDGDEPKTIRDRAILRLLHDIGLRRAELTALDVTDVDLERGEVMVLGKGRLQKRPLSLPGPTREALEAWLDIRGSSDGPLFINLVRGGKNDTRLSGTAVYKIVQGIGRKVGVETRPHGLRHLAITEAVRAAQKAGMGVEDVLDFSRHADLKTLMVYVDRERDTQGTIAAMVAGGATWITGTGVS